jgi:hypothetical protein
VGPRTGAWRVAGRGSDLYLGHAEGTQSPNWSRQQANPRPLTWGFIMERVTRIELALSAWEADVLPLNYTRVRRRLSRCPMPVHSTSCLAPGAEAVGSGRVSEGGHRCGGPELGRTVEAWKRVRVGPECRLESRSFHPVIWHLVSGEQQSDAALGEGTHGLDGAHRRPLCRWARVQHRFVPDAAGRAARPRPAHAVSPVCPAPQCGAGRLAEAGLGHGLGPKAGMALERQGQKKREQRGQAEIGLGAG